MNICKFILYGMCVCNGSTPQMVEALIYVIIGKQLLQQSAVLTHVMKDAPGTAPVGKNTNTNISGSIMCASGKKSAWTGFDYSVKEGSNPLFFSASSIYPFPSGLIRKTCASGTKATFFISL